MSSAVSSCMLDLVDDNYQLEDYQSAVPRWCVGCGDHGVLTAIQRLCRDENLPPEKTLFVSGIGCSSRFPHYMSTYGFHGLHGRALPIAEGAKIKRPDLNVFVIMGDGDCCSIGDRIARDSTGDGGDLSHRVGDRRCVSTIQVIVH